MDGGLGNTVATSFMQQLKYFLMLCDFRQDRPLLKVYVPRLVWMMDDRW